MEHELRVTKAVYAALNEPLAMMNGKMFDDMASQGDTVIVHCTDDPTYAPFKMRVTGIAAVCERVDE
jgi:hypothetical protein